MSGLVPRDYRHLVAAAVAQGWTRIDTSRHIMLLPPDKAAGPVVIPVTASDHRGMLNARADLRQKGVIV